MTSLRDDVRRSFGRVRRRRRGRRRGVARTLFLAALPAAILATTACAPDEPTPSAPASVAPDAPAFVVELGADPAFRTRLAVFDGTGSVAEARSADAAEMAAAGAALSGDDAVVMQGAGGDVIVVAWVATPCDREATLAVERPVLTLRLAPRRGCDALAIVRGVALRFVGDVDVATLRVQLIPAPILPEVEPATPVAPPPTAEG